jgi:hypothetical protein
VARRDRHNDARTAVTPRAGLSTLGFADELSDVLDALLVERQNGGAALRRESRTGGDGI